PPPLPSFPTRRSSDLRLAAYPRGLFRQAKPLDELPARLVHIGVGAAVSVAGVVNGCGSEPELHEANALAQARARRVHVELFDARSEEHTSELQSLAYL